MHHMGPDLQAGIHSVRCCVYHCTHTPSVDALKSMKDYWKMDMSFSLNLLKQFLEDMEAYSNVS